MWKWILPTFAILLLTPFSGNIDLSVAKYAQGIYQGQPFYQFFYYYGLYLGFIPFAAGAVMIVLSYLKPSYLPFRKAGWLLVLVFLIVPGLLVNALFKEHWGRPRPRQVVEFGGEYPFYPYYQPTFHKYSEPMKSFPSGHATMGFYYFALAIAGKRLRCRWLHISGYLLAFSLGIALAVTRIVMNGHFLTDVVFSGYICWMVTLAVEWLLYERAYKTTK